MNCAIHPAHLGIVICKESNLNKTIHIFKKKGGNKLPPKSLFISQIFCYPVTELVKVQRDF
jgi:hypothetical protein